MYFSSLELNIFNSKILLKLTGETTLQTGELDHLEVKRTTCILIKIIFPISMGSIIIVNVNNFLYCCVPSFILGLI